MALGLILNTAKQEKKEKKETLQMCSVTCICDVVCTGKKLETT
jgi:hypothetical protein